MHLLGLFLLVQPQECLIVFRLAGGLKKFRRGPGLENVRGPLIVFLVGIHRMRQRPRQGALSGGGIGVRALRVEGPDQARKLRGDRGVFSAGCVARGQNAKSRAWFVPVMLADVILVVAAAQRHGPVRILHGEVTAQRPVRFVENVRNLVAAFRDVQIAVMQLASRVLEADQGLFRGAQVVGEDIAIAGIVVATVKFANGLAGLGLVIRIADHVAAFIRLHMASRVRECGVRLL